MILHGFAPLNKTRLLAIGVAKPIEFDSIGLLP
jgi:hypothetical protein